MASQRSFIMIKPNHFSFIQAYITYVSFQAILCIQKCPIFSGNFVEFFFLLIYYHYKKCLPLQNLRLYYAKRKITLAIVQHNFLPFVVVPIIFSVFHLYLLYNEICLLIKILNPRAQWRYFFRIITFN